MIVTIVGSLFVSGNIHLIQTDVQSLQLGSFGNLVVGGGGISSEGDITLKDGDVILTDAGTEFGRLSNVLGGLTLKSDQNNNLPDNFFNRL